MAGGELRSDSGAAFGVSAIEFVGRFNVTHAVISTGAVDAGSAASWTTISRKPSSPAWCWPAAPHAGRHRPRQFGRQGLVQVCGFDGVDEIVTDRAPPADIAAALARGRCQADGRRRG